MSRLLRRLTQAGLTRTPEPDARPKRPPEPDVEPKPRKGGGAGTAAKGFAKARGAIRACGNQHGAMEGTNIQVAFDVRDGRATNISVQRPYGLTPLGRCIAKAVGNKARFSASVKSQRFSRAVSF